MEVECFTPQLLHRVGIRSRPLKCEDSCAAVDLAAGVLQGGAGSSYSKPVAHRHGGPRTQYHPVHACTRTVTRGHQRSQLGSQNACFQQLSHCLCVWLWHMYDGSPYSWVSTGRDIPSRCSVQLAQQDSAYHIGVIDSDVLAHDVLRRN